MPFQYFFAKFNHFFRGLFFFPVLPPLTSILIHPFDPIRSHGTDTHQHPADIATTRIDGVK